MVDKIPTLGMDMAFSVVHAHESRLSINEDDAGIGYAKIYRALLKATGKERGVAELSISRPRNVLTQNEMTRLCCLKGNLKANFRNI